MNESGRQASQKTMASADHVSDQRINMAERTPEKLDALLGTGDAVLGLPIPDNASEHYMRSRLATEQAIKEGRLDTVEDIMIDELPSRGL